MSTNTNSFEDDIVQNMNANGGGLAVNITGRYESNRKALADLDNEKRTAGEVAKSLRKDGHAIYAAEIKKVCEEWHHAGFKPKSAGGGMARTFYTSKSNAQVLEDLEKLRKEEARKK